jgi:uncharacterized membrane protein
MSFSLSLSILILLTFIILWLFSYFFKENKHKKLSILFFTLAPLVFLIFTVNHYGYKLLYIFISFMLLGAMGEFCLGYLYHKIFKRKLWEYKTFKLGKEGYTSYLSIPFWGMAGIMFWAVSLLFF